MLKKHKFIGLVLAVVAVLFGMVICAQAAQAAPLVSVPSDPVNMKVWPGANSYLDTTLSNVPPGYDVTNGTYPGWCTDKNAWISPNPTYTVTLHSSYELGLPAHLQDEDWDMVNYILNHKHPNADLYDIQDAIWYFIGGGSYPSDAEAIAMVEDALANGEGFVPAVGQVVAVICDAGPRVQQSIIEVEVTEHEIIGCGKTIGFWKHQLKVQIDGKGRGHVDGATLQAYLNQIEALALPEPFQFDGSEYPAGTGEFESAFAVLSSTSSDAVDLLKKQLLGTELNHMHGIGLHDKVWQMTLITWGEYLVANSGSFTRAELINAKDIFDAINNSNNCSCCSANASAKMQKVKKKKK